MRRTPLIFLLILILATSIVVLEVYPQPSQKYMLDTLNLLVDKTLKAYNAENPIEFYRYFADKMEDVAKCNYFEAVYVDGYKKALGFIESRELLEDESSFDPDFPVLAYKCEFEKNPCVFMTVNFIKEDDTYRITQIRFDKIYY